VGHERKGSGSTGVVTLRAFVVKYLRDIAAPGLGMAAAND
jgi:hypothetical protein